MEAFKPVPAEGADDRVLDRCLDAMGTASADPRVMGFYAILVLDDGRVLIGADSASEKLVHAMTEANEGIGACIGAAIARATSRATH